MADVFDVVADPTRRDILRLLHHAPTPGEMSVGELVEALGVTQPTVSKHLKILRDAGVVGVREVGQHRYYRGELGALADVGAWMVEVGQGAEETPAPPYVDLTFAGRAFGSVVRDVEKWATSLWGRLPR